MFFKLLRYIQSLYSNRKMEEINKEQKAFWSGKGGEIWVSKQDSMDIMLSPLGEEAIKKLNLSSDENVLDIGCGKGYFLKDLKKRYPKSNLYGFDISNYAIKKSDKNSDNKLFVHDVLKKTKFSKKYFDLFAKNK